MQSHAAGAGQAGGLKLSITTRPNAVARRRGLTRLEQLNKFVRLLLFKRWLFNSILVQLFIWSIVLSSILHCSIVFLVNLFVQLFMFRGESSVAKCPIAIVQATDHPFYCF